jgi:O-antigen ligase
MSNIILIPLFAFLGLSYANPLAGLYVAIAATPLYIVRFPIWGIPTNLFEVLVIVLALVVGAKQISKSSPNQLTRPRELSVGILLLVVGLIIGVAVAPNQLAALGIVKGWFVIPAILGLLAWRLIDTKQPNLIAPALLLSTLPISLLAVWQSASGQFITIDGRASAWFISPNYLSLYLAPILLFSLGWLSSQIGLKQIIGWLVWLLASAALYLSFSFGGWIAVGAGLIIFWALSKPHRRWLGYGIIGIVAAAVILYFTNSRFAELLDFSQRSSSSVRLQVWSASLLMIKENWLTGLGLGSFEANYLQYVLRLFNPPLETGMLHPHNLFLQLAISTGLAGLIGFFAIVIQWWRKLFSSPWNVHQASLAAAMAAVLIHGLVDTTVFKNDLAVIFWLIIATLYLPYVKKS